MSPECSQISLRSRPNEPRSNTYECPRKSSTSSKNSSRARRRAAAVANRAERADEAIAAAAAEDVVGVEVAAVVRWETLEKR